MPTDPSRGRSVCFPQHADRSRTEPQERDALLHRRFVVGWVVLYYGGDDDVRQDSELQHWITDINTHGFTHDSGVCLCNVSLMLSSIPRRKLFVSSRPSGFPQSFQTRAEVSQFVTMIIFSCSALHAAVNFSQVGHHLRLDFLHKYSVHSFRAGNPHSGPLQSDSGSHWSLFVSSSWTSVSGCQTVRPPCCVLLQGLKPW